MKNPIIQFCRWRLFHFASPWHYAYHQVAVDPPPTDPPPVRYKNWRALCGAQFTLNADKELDSPPQDERVCQKCLRALTACPG